MCLVHDLKIISKQVFKSKNVTKNKEIPKDRGICIKLQTGKKKITDVNTLGNFELK